MSPEVWTGGAAGIIGALGVAIVNFYAQRGKIKADSDKAKAEIKTAAETAAAAQKVSVRKDTIEEWQKIAGYHEQTVIDLRGQNGRQQAQLNELQSAAAQNAAEIALLKSAGGDWESKHKECEAKYTDLVCRFDAAGKAWEAKHSECEERHTELLCRLEAVEGKQTVAPK